MNFNSSNKTTESSLDTMAQRRTAFLNSGKPSKYEAGIISEAICPASTDEKLPGFLNTDASLAIPDNPIDLNNYIDSYMNESNFCLEYHQKNAILPRMASL